VSNERQYFMSPRTNGLGATRTSFVENIILGGGEAATLPGPYPGAVWRNNMVWQTKGLGAMPADTVIAVDPNTSPKMKEHYAPRPGTVNPLTADALLKLIRTR
jgi:hypothetical protein